MANDDAGIAPNLQLAASLLEQARAQAEKLTLASRAPSTIEAYQHDWDVFFKWCETVNLEPLPATPETVALFLATEETRGLSPSTINRRLAAINLAHEMARLPRFADKPEVIGVMRGVRRTAEHKPQKKKALFSEQLQQLVDQVDPSTNVGLRDRALLLVGFAGAFRRSELVGIDLQDIEFVEEGMLVTLWQSKTDQERESTVVAIPKAQNPDYCPIVALRKWVAAAGISSDAVFLRMYKADSIGKTRLTPQSVALVVKQYARLAGLPDLASDPDCMALHYGGHSLRRGFLSSAARNGAELLKMAAHSRHKSLEVLKGYIEEANRFENHPGGKLL